MSWDEGTTSVAVLIVDDTRANLIALEAALGPLDVRIVAARSGAEALELIETTPFAVDRVLVPMPDPPALGRIGAQRMEVDGRAAILEALDLLKPEGPQGDAPHPLLDFTGRDYQDELRRVLEPVLSGAASAA